MSMIIKKQYRDLNGTLSGCILNGCKKEVNAMTCDESLYRQYLSGDDEGLNALMKKYGDP